MKRIRYKEIDRYKHTVTLPDIQLKPIGYVYRDINKKRHFWFIKPYFVTLFRDKGTLNIGYDDFTKAGRALVEIWEYTMLLTSREKTDEYPMVDIFKNLGP